MYMYSTYCLTVMIYIITCDSKNHPLLLKFNVLGLHCYIMTIMLWKTIFNSSPIGRVCEICDFCHFKVDMDNMKFDITLFIVCMKYEVGIPVDLTFRVLAGCMEFGMWITLNSICPKWKVHVLDTGQLGLSLISCHVQGKPTWKHIFYKYLTSF